MGFLPNERFISFLQSQEECELKVIEQEKEVTVLPPKDACKCHKEDLAKALNVSVLAVLVKIASQSAGCTPIDPNYPQHLRKCCADACSPFPLLFVASFISEAKLLMWS